jgi:hypothetical protein
MEMDSTCAQSCARLFNVVNFVYCEQTSF